MAVENILVSALALISPLSPLEVLEGKQSDTVQSVKIPNVASTSLATFLCSLDVEILDDNLVGQLTTTVRHSLATQGKNPIFSVTNGNCKYSLQYPLRDITIQLPN